MKKFLIPILSGMLVLSGLTVNMPVQAKGIFQMMNPFEWCSDDDDDWDHWYGYGPYDWYGPYGWGAPYGYPYRRTNTVVVLPPAETKLQAADIHRPE